MVTVDDTKKIINSLKSKYSSGVDNISTKLLKVVTDIIAQPLAHIVNQSLMTGVFPDRMKIARVIPLYKKGDPSIVDNYRPISLLSVISKLPVKVMYEIRYLFRN